MTNATDALRALLGEVLDECEGVGCYPCIGSMAPFEDLCGRIAHAIGRDCQCYTYEGRNCRKCFKPPYPDEEQPTATPAGSASGEDDALDYQMAASAEAAEVDRRGKRIAALQAEVAGLWENFRESVNETQDALIRAEAAEAEAARLRKLLCRIRDDRSWRTNDNTLWQDIIDAAMGSANGQG